jgi:hypothetical protein
MHSTQPRKSCGGGRGISHRKFQSAVTDGFVAGLREGQQRKWDVKLSVLFF